MKNMILAISIASFVALPSVAAVTGSASLTGMSFELVDLDLFDNITPELLFIDRPEQSHLGIQATASGPVHAIYHTAIWEPGLATSRSRYGNARAEVTGSGEISNAAITASGNLVDVVYEENLAFNFTANAFPFNGYTFKLTPNSKLIFSGLASVSAFSSGVGLEGGALHEGAWAQNFSSISAHSRLGTSFDGIFYSHFPDAGLAFDFFESRVISFSLINDGNTYLEGFIDATVQVTGRNSTTIPVPEPSTFAVFSMGLLALSAILRARKV